MNVVFPLLESSRVTFFEQLVNSRQSLSSSRNFYTLWMSKGFPCSSPVDQVCFFFLLGDTPPPPGRGENVSEPSQSEPAPKPEKKLLFSTAKRWRTPDLSDIFGRYFSRKSVQKQDFWVLFNSPENFPSFALGSSGRVTRLFLPLGSPLYLSIGLDLILCEIFVDF